MKCRHIVLYFTNNKLKHIGILVLFDHQTRLILPRFKNVFFLFTGKTVRFWVTAT